MTKDLVWTWIESGGVCFPIRTAFASHTSSDSSFPPVLLLVCINMFCFGGKSCTFKGKTFAKSSSCFPSSSPVQERWEWELTAGGSVSVHTAKTIRALLTSTSHPHTSANTHRCTPGTLHAHWALGQPRLLHFIYSLPVFIKCSFHKLCINNGDFVGHQANQDG